LYDLLNGTLIIAFQLRRNIIRIEHHRLGIYVARNHIAVHAESVDREINCYDRFLFARGRYTTVKSLANAVVYGVQ